MDAYEKLYNYVNENVRTDQHQIDFIAACLQKEELWFQDIQSKEAKAIMTEFKNGKYPFNIKFSKNDNNLTTISCFFVKELKNKRAAKNFSEKEALAKCIEHIPFFFKQFNKTNEHSELSDLEQSIFNRNKQTKESEIKKLFKYSAIFDVDIEKVFTICFFILTVKELWKNNIVPEYKVFEAIYNVTPMAFNRDYIYSTANANSQNLTNIMKLEEFIDFDLNNNIKQESLDLIELNYAY